MKKIIMSIVLGVPFILLIFLPENKYIQHLCLIMSYILVVFAALTAVGFGIKKMMQNTNNAKKTLYTAGGLVVVFIIAYLLASDEALVGVTPATAKKVGAGLISFYILAIGAIGAVFYSELSKVFSK